MNTPRKQAEKTNHHEVGIVMVNGAPPEPEDNDPDGEAHAEGRISKDEYKRLLPALKAGMRPLEQRLRAARIPVIVLLEGLDTAGKGDSIQQVTEALDPRGFTVHAIGRAKHEEKHQAWLRRFWLRLPARGHIAFFERSWYTRVLQERVEHKLTSDQLTATFEEINETERLLVEDGTVLIKIWLDITKKKQRSRLRAAERDPFRGFTVTVEEWDRHGLFDAYQRAAERMIVHTDSDVAPWISIDANHKRERRLAVLTETTRRLTDALAAHDRWIAGAGKPSKDSRLAAPPMLPQTSAPALPPLSTREPLERVNLAHTLARETYKDRLMDAQMRLRGLQQRILREDIAVIITYTGWDAAGKGGSIRRMTATLDPRGYNVVPIGKPTAEELAHPYLWRFWRHIPSLGHLTIFDRSWYERVLVERIEGFCTEADWQRAYGEIRAFERQLVRSRIVPIKFWFHISSDEQLARFKARENDPHRAWKLTDEDWRNREKWGAYETAANEMIRRTSTPAAPWLIIEGNCKMWARVKSIELTCELIERALAGSPLVSDARLADGTVAPFDKACRESDEPAPAMIEV